MQQSIQLIISYDGTRFFGWQKTSTGISVEEELEKALQQVLRSEVQLEAASRTDRGVHAMGQTVSFHTDLPIDVRSLKHSINAVLPADISVKEVTLSNLHPTLDAKSKEYHYFICNSPAQNPIHRLYSWHVPTPLDIQKMRLAAKDLVGRYDFSSFTSEPQEDNMRTIENIEIQSMDDNRLRIEMRADRFLYKMARTIAGTLVYVGMRKLAADSLPAILLSKLRKSAGITAPAHGLMLMRVFYL